MAAIYQPKVWKDFWLTTTLYPVEVVESVVFGISITDGYMLPLVTEAVAGSADLVGGVWFQARWFYEDGPYDDAVQGSADLAGGVWFQARWFYEDGPYDDSVQGSADLLSGYLVNKLVEADSPDEMLQLGCTVQATCSMTAV